jgi:hypothetical protein
MEPENLEEFKNLDGTFVAKRMPRRGDQMMLMTYLDGSFWLKNCEDPPGFSEGFGIEVTPEIAKEIQKDDRENLIWLPDCALGG